MSFDPHQAEGLPPELELILCCLRNRSTAAAADRLRTLLQRPLSWSDVVATALEHHVEIPVYESLEPLESDLVPAASLELLRSNARKAGGLAILYFSELVHIQEVFDEASVPLIPYKGPVLGWLAYQSLTRRRFLDLDFFIPQEHIPRASALLVSSGLKAEEGQQENMAGRKGPVPGQYGFLREATRTQVELHTERTLRYFPVPLDFEKMSRRLITMEVAGRKLRTFSIEDTLIMLCVHGAKHFWERIGWVLDVAELIKAQPVDWEKTMRIAAKLKSTRLLLLGLYLADELLGASLPPAIIEQARRDSSVVWLAGKVQAELAGKARMRMGVLPRTVFRYRSRDRMGDAVRHVLRLAMSPTESDRQTVRLPVVLAPFYALVRPWRLLREYGLGLKRRLKPDLAIYDPTPPEIVNLMLRLAGVSPGDVLYDLGCGDGRIVVTAAEKYGIHAVGVDIDPKRIAEARANARRHGVEHLAQFHESDAKKFSVADATVVTLYLGADTNLRLVEQLRSGLRPGARIVSRNFKIHGWPPDRTETHAMPDGILTFLFLWIIKKKDEGETRGAGYAVPELRGSRKPEG